MSKTRQTRQKAKLTLMLAVNVAWAVGDNVLFINVLEIADQFYKPLSASEIPYHHAIY